jgi:inward rectifier potassium channel
MTATGPTDETTFPATPWIPAHERDLGFGAVVARNKRRRLLNRDGSFNVRRRGLRFWKSLSLYNWLLQISWTRFFLIVTVGYVAANALFATMYYAAGPGTLAGPLADGRWSTAFFFSVHTLATIGYGVLSPNTLTADVLVSIEALVGLLGLALTTGILFARFSRPVPRILYSDRALIAPYRGSTAFMFRIANERSSQIVELEAKIVLALFDRADGHATRRFTVLSLERTRVAFFPLTWTVVHPIDESSPLHGLSAEDLAARGAEFLVLLTGMDETFSQTVHSRSSYRYDELEWAARFSDIFEHDDAANDLYVDISRIHAFEKT